LEPGARDVFTYRRNFQSAFHGSLGEEAGAEEHMGFEVLVQEVMAAITTWPSPMRVGRSLKVISNFALGERVAA
jgi:hypothetical protein